MSKDDLFRKFYAKGVRLLAGREHSEVELRKKLLRGGWSRTRSRQAKDHTRRDLKDSSLPIQNNTCQLNQAVKQLKTDGLLSDARYSESFIFMRTSRGYGPEYLTNELRKHGISEELIEQGLHSNNICWVDVAKKIVGKHYRNEGAEPTSWEKKARFLKNRGFPTEVILHCLGNREG